MSVWIGGGSKEKFTGDEPSRSRYALLGNPTSTGAQINTILYCTSTLFLYSGIACMLEGTTNHDLFLKIVTVTGGIVMLSSYGLFCYYSYVTHAERYNIRTTEKDLKPAVSRRGSSASRNSRRPPSTGTAAEGLLSTTTNDVSERQAIATTSGTLTVPKRSQDLSSPDSPIPKKLPEEEAAEAAAAAKERAEKKALSRKNAIKLVITAIVTGVLGYFMTKNMESFSLNSGIRSRHRKAFHKEAILFPQTLNALTQVIDLFSGSSQLIENALQVANARVTPPPLLDDSPSSARVAIIMVLRQNRCSVSGYWASILFSVTVNYALVTKVWQRNRKPPKY
ncbi:hypothetical protein B0H13DRAFT_1851122 [Mycena leptocephala]|nr:hypothetical protein B0H13DRAFT_1851122 [Mycena leptocephala]